MSWTIRVSFLVLCILGSFWSKPIKDVNLFYILKQTGKTWIKDEAYNQEKKVLIISTVHLQRSRFQKQSPMGGQKHVWRIYLKYIHLLLLHK